MKDYNVLQGPSITYKGHVTIFVGKKVPLDQGK